MNDGSSISREEIEAALQNYRKKLVLAMLTELAQGEVVSYGSELIYGCTFCDPDEEGQHKPTCLVIRAQQFLKSLEQS